MATHPFIDVNSERPRPPRILDVLNAVTRVAREHPAIESWWYTPPRRLPLHGELPRPATDPLEIVVKARTGAPDCAKIAADLEERLGAVTVRPHLGPAEERHLFRLITGKEAAP